MNPFRRIPLELRALSQHMKHHLHSVVIFILVLCFFPQCRGGNVPSSQIVDAVHLSIPDADIRDAEGLMTAYSPFLDLLDSMSDDTNDLINRLASQAYAYETINVLLDRYVSDKTDLSVRNVIDKDIIPRLLNVTGKWFYDKYDLPPLIWRDLFYVSAKGTDDYVEGYFHIMVFPPTEDGKDSELLVAFPESAVSSPFLAFSKGVNPDTLEEDRDNLVATPFDQWFERGEYDEGFPVYARAGHDIVDKMLTYDFMYILFSRGQDPDDTDMLETARLDLSYFQQKYYDYINQQE
ncbi:MAG: hypothetical protein IKI13_09375 [Bacteroidales bacterium]|nr:hypothetical protein [Bacteroidales bacterium]